MWHPFLVSQSKKNDIWQFNLNIPILPLMKWFIATKISMTSCRPQVSKVFFFPLKLRALSNTSHKLGQREYNLSGKCNETNREKTAEMELTAVYCTKVIKCSITVSASSFNCLWGVNSDSNLNRIEWTTDDVNIHFWSGNNKKAKLD